MGVNALEVRRRVMLAQPHEAVASGAVASFRTDVVSPLPMEFDLVPIQDLHGQDAPYPPGGGKNKFNPNSTEKKWVSISGSISERTDSKSITMPVSEGEAVCLSNANNASPTNIILLVFYDSADNMLLRKPVSNGEKYVSDVAPEGTTYLIASFFTWSEASNAQLETGTSTPTAFAPYSNICPITGHDGFTRTGTGKNLFNQDIVFASLGFTHEDDGSWSRKNITGINGAVVWKNPGFTSQISITFTAKYATDASTGIRFRIVFTDGTSQYCYLTPHLTYTQYTFTSTSGKIVSAVVIDYGSNNIKTWIKDMQIEQGTATAYQAYDGTSYSTTFPTPPGTVYGGHVTDNGDGTGTLVVDTVNKVFDGTESLTATRSSASDCYVMFTVGAKGDIVAQSGLSNMLNAVSSNVGTKDFSQCMQNSNAYDRAQMAFRLDSSFDGGNVNNTIANYQAELLRLYEAGTPLQVTYMLATPIEYTLSMDAITSLLGQNNIWVDNADSVSVEYWGH